MAKHRHRAARAGPAPARRPAVPAPPLPLAHPALLAAALAAAATLVLAVTFPLADTDFWQHLAVGRAIWSAHAVPATNLWTWPTHGEAQVLPSWGFRALLWPFWALGGVTGLFVWRWATTLAAFGIAWAAARAMGARGMTPLVAIAASALVYRGRSQVRPETLVAILLALEIWVLERRRRNGDAPAAAPAPWWRGPGPALVAIAWVWANVHISYDLGLLLIGIHLAADHLPGRGAAAAAPRAPLGFTLLAAVAVSFANPFGWRALAQPFEYFFVWRHEPIFATIGELGTIDWSVNVWNGVPLAIAGWPLLALWRGRRAGWDPVEIATLVLFLGAALASQRFLGPFAIACAPYLGRDLEAFVRARRWPAWTGGAGARAGLAAGACAALLPLGWIAPEFRPGLGVAPLYYPRAACDWIAAHDVRGRAFNSFEWGGYLLWRFWPDPARLPFMDIHQTGTRADRLDYVRAMTDPGGWRALDARRRFDWALVKALHAPGVRTLDILDADTSFALVFVDDAAALYVRRQGPLAALAERSGYRLLPAGEEARVRLGERMSDPAARAATERELRRAIAESPLAANASSVLASLLMVEGRWAEARDALERARRIQPDIPHYADRMATIDAALGSAPR